MKQVWIACCTLLFGGIFNNVVAQPNRNCKVTPSFTSTIGFDVQKTYFSTSERKTMGLVFAELPAKEGDMPRTWQHPTWKDAGWLGPMQITEKGEIFVGPVPVVTLQHNKPEEQNFLWKVESKTGEMKKVLELPRPDSAFRGQNPYGILALGYDCDNGVLYASSVAGSSLNSEIGNIFAIRTSDLKIIAQIDSTDGFGLGVGTVNGIKKLYFGRARTGAIEAVELNADGTFKGQPVTELTLDNLGPRGDDRARKIRFETDGSLTVHGIEFYYNLTAPTEKQETVYKFRYNVAQKQWQRTQ